MLWCVKYHDSGRDTAINFLKFDEMDMLNDFEYEFRKISYFFILNITCFLTVQQPFFLAQSLVPNSDFSQYLTLISPCCDSANLSLRLTPLQKITPKILP